MYMEYIHTYVIKQVRGACSLAGGRLSAVYPGGAGESTQGRGVPSKLQHDYDYDDIIIVIILLVILMIILILFIIAIL